MKIPVIKTNAYKVAMHVHATGPQSLQSLIDYAGSLLSRPAKGAELIDTMVDRGQLVGDGATYDINAHVRSHFDNLEPVEEPEVVEVVAPRYIPPFKPWTGKFSFARSSDAHFFTSGTAAEPKVRGVAL